MTSIRIFVSYTIRDAFVNENLLLYISDLLVLYGQPFIDLLHNNSLNPQARVEQELRSANILLLLNSLSADHSNWVKWELKRARDLEIPVVQVQVDSCINFEALGHTIKEKLSRQLNYKTLKQ